MTEGDSDITTNDRRFTIEKRGNPAGTVAWRVITSNDQIDTVGAERVVRHFDPSHTVPLEGRVGRQPFQPDDQGRRRERQHDL